MLCILPKLNRFWYLRLQKWMQKKNIQAYSWKVVGNSIWKFQRGANGHQRRFWVGTWIMGYPRISRGLPVIRASLVAQMVKYLPAMRETWIQFLGQEDPLEKEMAIHSSTLAWKTPWTEDPDRLQSMGLQRVGYDWGLHSLTHSEEDPHALLRKQEKTSFTLYQKNQIKMAATKFYKLPQ